MLELLERFGPLLIFAVLFFDQLGLPIPATPIVLALGALAGRGAIDPVASLAVAAAGSLGADLVWYQIGRRKGAQVLALVCKIALEPDTCVSMTKGIFSRHGVKSLLVAKFVPGFDTVAPPLAGMLGVGLVRFVLWSVAGALLWLLAFGGLGYLFSSQMEELAVQLEQLGSGLALLAFGVLAAYLGWKYLGRRRVLLALRMARIAPEELHRMILAGEVPVIVDVRHELSLETLPFTIPGAISLTLEELEHRHHEVPRDREVIVYCS